MKFLTRVIKDLKKTGAIAPSSKFLAQDIVKQLETRLNSYNCAPLNILELGAGTGSLTKEITKLLRPADRLDIVEIQKSFFEIVRKKFTGANVHVHCADILNFNPSIQYDYIFSSLPYENMPAVIIKKIWEKKLSLCAPHSYICYYKYINFNSFKSNFEEKMVKRYGLNKKTVLRNLPPAKLYTLQIDNQNDSPYPKTAGIL